MQATTLSGTSASQVAEYVVMMMLALRPQAAGNVFFPGETQGRPNDPWERFNPLELRNSTVGLVGYGSIGRQVARLLQPFGAKILAAKRDVMHPEDDGYIPDGMGDPGGDFFTRLYPIQAIQSMLKECDFDVIAHPYLAKPKT